ncbi:nuclear transport factor 2 family protein [Neoaquamicrobium sediminum]|uniref:nuclear transport factor 2 family protein n=1 Tax=Neoaquamicrobium sediminum TaxID=1849104 RepID=UPI0019D5606A|nr:nuclear transport factor 2 family protein [Mesorhizobium sediminum]
MTDNASIARDCYLAYVSGDRAAIEALIAPDFHFTSPLDNRIDRKAYFERCWPNSGNIKDFRFERIVPAGDDVVVTYVGEAMSGRKFRNTEVLTVRGGTIVEAEVYFGWNVPHDAPEGGSLGSDSDAGASMKLTTVYANLNCSNLETSTDWFARLFGRVADATPMQGLAEWHHGKTAGLQLFENAQNAGKGTLTLFVENLEDERERLEKASFQPGAIEPATYVRLLRMRDPDGNLVVLAQPKS